MLSRALWQLVVKHNLAFVLAAARHQQFRSNIAKTMLLSLITINALAASALAPSRSRLPVQQRRQQSSSISMRYGRKQLKIRQRVKSDLQRVVTIDDLAEVISSPEFYLANRRMSGRLMTKIQKKAASLGYQIGLMSEEEEEMFDELSEEEFAEELRAAERGDVSAAAAVEVSEPAPAPAPAPAAPAEPLPIAADVDTRVIQAMKARDKDLTSTLRLIKTALTNAAKESGVEAIDDDEAIKVLRKMSKMRQESIEMFEKGGEPERAAAEKAELDVIAQWLPALASEDTVRGWIQSLIDDGNTNPGKLMGMLMKDHKDELDGKMARELCNEMCG